MQRSGIIAPFRASLAVVRRGPIVPGPINVARRHLPSLLGKLAMERWIAFSRAMPSDLRSLATLRAGALVGCVW